MYIVYSRLKSNCFTYSQITWNGWAKTVPTQFDKNHSCFLWTGSNRRMDWSIWLNNTKTPNSHCLYHRCIGIDSIVILCGLWDRRLCRAFSNCHKSTFVISLCSGKDDFSEEMNVKLKKKEILWFIFEKNKLTLITELTGCFLWDSYTWTSLY